MAGITLKNVTFGYSKQSTVLEDISVEITPGQFLGVTGVNGSGKSTFSYLLNGLIPHNIRGYLQGEIAVDGVSTRTKPVSFFSKKVGMLFQNPDFSLFNLTVREEILFGIRNLGLDNEEQRVNDALALVGISAFKDRDPHSLSLGEKQKVNLACVLAMKTHYIVLDEPTAMLDYKSSVNLYTILKALQKEGLTIIVIEHDTDFLYTYATHTLLLDSKKILRAGETTQVFADKKLLDQLGIKKPHTL